MLATSLKINPQNTIFYCFRSKLNFQHFQITTFRLNFFVIFIVFHACNIEHILHRLSSVSLDCYLVKVTLVRGLYIVWWWSLRKHFNTVEAKLFCSNYVKDLWRWQTDTICLSSSCRKRIACHVCTRGQCLASEVTGTCRREVQIQLSTLQLDNMKRALWIRDKSIEHPYAILIHLLQKFFGSR